MQKASRLKLPPSKPDESDENYGPHPLFPVEEGEEEITGIGSISVGRWNPRLNILEFAPLRFMAEDLLDAAVLFERWGGGKYTLVGRNRAGNRIVKRVVIHLAGKSRPLVESPEDEELPLAAQPPQQLAPQPQQRSQGDQNALATLLPLLVPMVIEYMKNSAAERQAQQLQSVQMMQQVMQQGQANSQAFIQAMASVYTKPGGSSSGDFQAGIQWMENFIAGKMEEAQKGDGDSEGDIMKVLGQAFEAAKLIAQNAPPGAAPAV